MLAESHRQAAEDIEQTVLQLQGTLSAARMVIEGAWGAAFQKKAIKTIPAWIDSLTGNLIVDLIGILAEQHLDLLAVILYGSVARHDERPLGSNPSDVDLLAIFDSDDLLLAVNRGDTLSHTIGLAYNRHLDVPREVQVMFASRNFQEWDPTFIANVARDGIVLFNRGPIPAALGAYKDQSQSFTRTQ